ncbi:endonuclease [Helicobacter sp. 12S02634-8]|nr:DNA/RNA non-specific endonuclease [Helicobacter sp. 12S02634-8]PAF46150.1 endonuclease [Helicobacter sp. 12S02634-8]
MQIALFANAHQTDKVYTQYKLYPPFAKYFKHCDLKMNKFYYINCYDFDYKGTQAVAYRLEARILKLGAVGKRPSFKADNQVPLKYRTKTQDYTKSGFDRGHTLSNQSMNATIDSQKSTFLMSNITPQNPQINRTIWKKAEDRERALAKAEGSAEVLNIVIYPKDKSKLKFIHNNIAIPIAYVKIIETKDTKECYEFPNHEVENESLESYKVRCGGKGD